MLLRGPLCVGAQALALSLVPPSWCPLFFCLQGSFAVAGAALLVPVHHPSGTWVTSTGAIVADEASGGKEVLLLTRRRRPQNQVAGSLTQARAALDASSKSAERKYGGTEEFVRDVARLLQHTLAASEVGDEVHTACSGLLQQFKSAWSTLGEHSDPADDSRFYIYVDLMKEQQQGFKLFEVYGDVEDKGANKAYVQAREWRHAKESEYSGGFDPHEIRLVAAKPKPQRLCWTRRRDLQGVVESETMRVKVAKKKKAGGAHGEEGQLLTVAQQGTVVAKAFVRLRAQRALQHAPQARGEADTKHEGLDDVGPRAADGGDMEEGEEEEEGEMSAYELARLKRMEENKRLLQATGIMEMVQQVEGAVEEGQEGQVGGRARGSPNKRKRALASGGADGDGEERVRGLRSKVRAPAGRVHEQVKMDLELDKASLSDSETPLKSDALPLPSDTSAPAAGQAGMVGEAGGARGASEACQPDGGEVAARGPGEQTAQASSAGSEGAAAGGRQAKVAGGGGLMPAELPFPPNATYVAREDDTPRMIAKMFGRCILLRIRWVDCLLRRAISGKHCAMRNSDVVYCVLLIGLVNYVVMKRCVLLISTVIT